MNGDVFLLVFDSLRRDHAEPYSDKVSTQSLSRIADDSYVLENAYSTGSWTIPAHGSMFTGERPSHHGATGVNKRLPTQNKTIAEVADENGYEPVAISTNPWISPDFDFFRGFSERSEFIYPKLPFPDIPSPEDAIVGSRGAAQNLLNILRWSAERDPAQRLFKAAYNHFLFQEELPDATTVTNHLLEATKSTTEGEPVLAFANYMDTHEPYFDDSRNCKMSWNLRSIENQPGVTPSEIKEVYADSVSTLDNGISALIDGLQCQSRYEDALIIAVADHGQCLGEHGYWGHGTFLYDELLHVPAYIKPPGGLESATSVGRPFSLREVFDLIADVVRGNEDVGERLESSGDEVVVAESTGPHMDVELSTAAVSRSGYWKFYADKWSAEKNLDTGKVRVTDNPLDFSETEIIARIETIIDEEGLTVVAAGDDSKDLDVDVENRLDHLGYK